MESMKRVLRYLASARVARLGTPPDEKGALSKVHSAPGSSSDGCAR